MGDGVAYTNLTSVKHAYLDYGTYEIKASGRCAKCGDAFSIAAPSRLVVEKQPISAAFTIRASATSPKAISGTIAQGRQVTLSGQSSPDIARREWTCNGQIILGDDGKPKQGAAIEYRCKDVGEFVFGLTVFDEAGSSGLASGTSWCGLTRIVTPALLLLKSNRDVLLRLALKTIGTWQVTLPKYQCAS